MLADFNRLAREDSQHPPQPGGATRVDQHRRGKISAVEQISGRPPYYLRQFMYNTREADPSRNVDVGPIGQDRFQVGYGDD